ncbi:MAG: hypothetical protein COA99_05380 [Moraxellaceae bacterium]|nr:MAG: hypothetical protein COA99_05380 [Moraxellaceae bacterium]
MKSALIFIFSVLMVSNSYANLVGVELTKEQLTPFCKNEMIWSSVNVKFEQCIEASLFCTKEVAKQKLDWIKSQEAFNPCLMKRLGVGAPAG